MDLDARKDMCHIVAEERTNGNRLADMEVRYETSLIPQFLFLAKQERGQLLGADGQKEGAGL